MGQNKNLSLKFEMILCFTEKKLQKQSQGGKILELQQV